MTALNILDVLTAARNDLATNGIARGAYQDAQGRHCSMGAVVESFGMYGPMVNAAWRALRAASQDLRGLSPITLNDECDDASVLEMFDYAIKLVSEGQ